MINFFNRLANPVMIPLLKSPLHGFVSDHLMLVTFTGRKSGKRYSTPVEYKREGDTIMFYTRKERRWWKNLEGGAALTVRVQGHDIQVVPEALLDDRESVGDALAALHPKMSREKLDRLAAGGLVVRLRVQQPTFARTVE